MAFGRGARAASRAVLLALGLGLGLGACGSSHPATSAAAHRSRLQELASVTAGAGASARHAAGAGAANASAQDASRGAARAREIADPHEKESYPAPADVRHPKAAAPARAGEAIIAAGAASNAEVERDLQATEAAQRSAREALARKLTTPVPGGQSIGGDGTIPIPTNVPEVVQKVIAGANEIADFPYLYGGGHASFIDKAYDCSGSVSYALAAGGLLSSPEVSGELEHWGAPGPGRYITVYANAGHTFMYVDGVLYDTAGRSGVYASRWLVGSTETSGYVVRHWPGL